MTDPHDTLRKAVESGPTGGRWEFGAIFTPFDPNAVRALLAERDALVRDAERYRWLRDQCVGEDDGGWLILVFETSRQASRHPEDTRGRWIDADIDAAMQEHPC